MNRPEPVHRLVDLTVAAIAAIVTAPLIVAAAVAVRIGLGRPILFRHQRLGQHGQPFEVYKFRTMTDQRGPDGELLPDSDRLGTLGRLLRRTSIDELPQLLNVWRGEMAIVGPRPLPVTYRTRYTSHQARRMDVKPGITGLAQISGRNATDWATRLDIDVDYVDRRSIGLDLTIITRTIPAVLSNRGVTAPGHATMPEFTGTADAPPAAPATRTTSPDRDTTPAPTPSPDVSGTGDDEQCDTPQEPTTVDRPTTTDPGK